MDSQWFVLQTLSGQEQKVERSLNQRIAADEMGEFIDEVLVPMEKVVEVKGGKKSASSRKLFPGYVFIRMKLFDDEKRIIEKPWYWLILFCIPLVNLVFLIWSTNLLSKKFGE